MKITKFTISALVKTYNVIFFLNSIIKNDLSKYVELLICRIRYIIV